MRGILGFNMAPGARLICDLLHTLKKRSRLSSVIEPPLFAARCRGEQFASETLKPGAAHCAAAPDLKGEKEADVTFVILLLRRALCPTTSE
jgi:hypothetical protein